MTDVWWTCDGTDDGGNPCIRTFNTENDVRAHLVGHPSHTPTRHESENDQ